MFAGHGNEELAKEGVVSEHAFVALDARRRPRPGRLVILRLAANEAADAGMSRIAWASGWLDRSSSGSRHAQKIVLRLSSQEDECS